MNDPSRHLESSLSEAGQARKDEMLTDLLQALDRRGRRRKAGQASAGLFAMILLAIVAHISIPDRPAEPELAAGQPKHPGPAAPPDESVAQRLSDPDVVTVRFVDNDPSVLARLTARPSLASEVRYLDDEQLLASFSEPGISLGIARVAGRFEFIVNQLAP